MARQSRIDFPGALHHIIFRGMDGIKIFQNNEDRSHFLKRMGRIFEETATTCYAFALMSNHVHLLVVTGVKPLSRVMQSLLTGHAVYYNRKYRRKGKLYQNRYKSILCDKENYLLELVRYIHLNPFKARIVKSLSELERYPWSSHSLYLGKQKREWFDVDMILGEFAQTYKQARKEYREFIAAGLQEDDPIDYEGGGLIRSLGGYWETAKARKKKDRRKESADERILGSGEFVDYAIKISNEKERNQSKLKREGWHSEQILTYAASLFNLQGKDLLQRGRSNGRSLGRKLACKWMVDDLGMSQTEVGELLDISRQGVSKLLREGREIEVDLGVTLNHENP